MHLDHVSARQLQVISPFPQKSHFYFEEIANQTLFEFRNVRMIAIFRNNIIGYPITDYKQHELNIFFERGTKKSRAIPFGTTEKRVLTPRRQYVVMPLMNTVNIKDIIGYLKEIGACQYSMWMGGTKTDMTGGVWIETLSDHTHQMYIPMYLV